MTRFLFIFSLLASSVIFAQNKYSATNETILSKKEIQHILDKFPEFDDYSIKEDVETFYIKGDFFGDSIDDIAILIRDSVGSVKIGFINYKKKNKVKIYFLGGDNDPFVIDNYSWVGIFKKIPKGDILWSNYVDDFRSFDNVPESEKIKLTHDAILVHASESCGGGFIFWKNEKFNWLQQE